MNNRIVHWWHADADTEDTALWIVNYPLKVEVWDSDVDNMVITTFNNEEELINWFEKEDVTYEFYNLSEMVGYVQCKS